MRHDLDEEEAMGERLRQARKQAGLLQEDAAQLLGIPRTAVSAMENGLRRVSALELACLAGLYGEDASRLLLGTPPPLDDELARLVAQLSPADRELVLRYARFTAAHPREDPRRGHEDPAQP